MKVKRIRRPEEQAPLLPGVVVIAAIGLAAFGLRSWNDASADPRVRIEAEGPHQDAIARAVNRSDLWRAYLDRERPAKSGARPAATFALTMQRKTRKSYGGDYDPGNIIVTFRVTSDVTGEELYTRDADVNLEPFVIGSFDANTTREEIQEVAFRATEDKIYPYLERWVNIAAVRAMGASPAHREAFKRDLNGLLGDKWTSDDLKAEAEEALRNLG